MSDFTAGPPSAERDDGAGPLAGGPPPVLLAALAVALIIAVGLVAAFSSLGGGGSAQAPDRGVAGSATTADKRVLLTVSVNGTGIGRVQITQSDVSCNASCEYKFTRGARVTASAEPASGSTFDGWGDACSGKRCSIVMDRPRSLDATFTEKPVADPNCAGVPADQRDPTCPPDESGTTTTPVEPGPDCSDGIDNDNDGLTDTAQDPDCDTSGSESGATAAPPADTSPPPPVATDDCADGKDNDNDGLTDTAQDPNCVNGHSESGAIVRAAPRRGTRTPTRSECSDGRDNDGDGLIDSAQDPGCAANSTEAG